jgi:hypothetical protein
MPHSFFDLSLLLYIHPLILLQSETTYERHRRLPNLSDTKSMFFYAGLEGTDASGMDSFILLCSSVHVFPVTRETTDTSAILSRP